MRFFWAFVLCIVCLLGISEATTAQSDSLLAVDSLSSEGLVLDSLSAHDSQRLALEDSSYQPVEAPAVQQYPEPEYEAGMPREAKQNHTGIFYFLLLILLILGIFRLIEPTYFKHLFESFIATKRSVRQVKSKLGPDNLVNFLMNIVFYLIGGAFLYYSIQLFADLEWIKRWTAPIMILLFSLGLMLVYFVKMGFLMVLGKLFLIKDITDEYRYNIALINKMLALILIPVIFIMLFGAPAVGRIVTLISFVIIGLAIFNRYARSWDSMRYLVKNNRFHFFIYLCAFEILPFVVLAKVILSR